MSVDAYSVKKKQWVSVTTAKDVTADVAKSLLESLVECQQEKQTLMKEQTDLEKDNQRLEKQLQHVNLTLLHSLVIERADLHARILRIDQRIIALGFQPEVVIRRYAGLPEPPKASGQ